jgi:hypothetical protein
MFTQMLRANVASAAVILFALGGAVRAQEAAAPPLLYLVDSGETFMVHVMADPQHAGDAVFILATTAFDPEVAIAEGAVLDGQPLDAAGLYRGPFVPPAAVRVPGGEEASGSGGSGGMPGPGDVPQGTPAHLMAVVMDRSGNLHASSAVAMPTSAPGSWATTPVGPITPCLIIPACTPGQLPDLIVSSIVLNTATTSTGCTGAALPFVGCPNGRSFTITATITNIGTCGVPCNTPVSVKWGKGLTAGTIVFEAFNQTKPSPGLAPGGSMVFTRPYYMGPCDTVPPWTFHLDFFGAIVDPNNTIAELNEGNNTATPVAACNFE